MERRIHGPKTRQTVYPIPGDPFRMDHRRPARRMQITFRLTQ